MFKKLLVGASALVVVAIVLPALAQPSVDMSTDVRSVSLVGECVTNDDGSTSQFWELALTITVKNTSEDNAIFTQTGYFVKFRNPDGARQIGYDIEVVDPGGFAADSEVGPGQTGTFTPTVRVSIPCDATGADIFATLNLKDRDKTYLDGAPFLGEGTPVPIGPTGAVGIAVLCGAVLVLAQRLGRRPRSLEAPVETR